MQKPSKWGWSPERCTAQQHRPRDPYSLPYSSAVSQGSGLKSWLQELSCSEGTSYPVLSSLDSAPSLKTVFQLPVHSPGGHPWSNAFLRLLVLLHPEMAHLTFWVFVFVHQLPKFMVGTCCSFEYSGSCPPPFSLVVLFIEFIIHLLALRHQLIVVQLHNW